MFNDVRSVVKASNIITRKNYTAKDFYKAVGYGQTTISHYKINIPDRYEQMLVVGFIKLCELNNVELFNIVNKNYMSIVSLRLFKDKHCLN